MAHRSHGISNWLFMCVASLPVSAVGVDECARAHQHKLKVFFNLTLCKENLIDENVFTFKFVYARLSWLSLDASREHC